MVYGLLAGPNAADLPPGQTKRAAVFAYGYTVGFYVFGQLPGED